MRCGVSVHAVFSPLLSSWRSESKYVFRLIRRHGEPTRFCVSLCTPPYSFIVPMLPVLFVFVLICFLCSDLPCYAQTTPPVNPVLLCTLTHIPHFLFLISDPRPHTFCPIRVKFIFIHVCVSPCAYSTYIALVPAQ